MTKTHNVSIKFLGTIAALMCLAAPAAAQVTASHNVAFHAKKVSPYGGGPAFELSPPPYSVYSRPLDFSSEPLIDVDAGSALLGGLLPGIDLPSILRLKAGFGMFGSNNLEFGYYVTGGRLDIHYPASSRLEFETDDLIGNKLVIANNLYSIDSRFQPGVSQRTIPSEFWTDRGPGGPEFWLLKQQQIEGGAVVLVPAPPTVSTPNFAMTSPHAQAWLDSFVDARAGAYVDVEVLGGLIEFHKDFTANRLPFPFQEARPHCACQVWRWAATRPMARCSTPAT
jgi:hypothetical protein